jgi:hypothetical protein
MGGNARSVGTEKPQENRAATNDGPAAVFATFAWNVKGIRCVPEVNPLSP